MLKTLIVLAAAAFALSATGCCWPLHEGRYRGYDRWSEGQRPPPPGQYDRGPDRGHDGAHR
jgi:hypothetical protein